MSKKILFAVLLFTVLAGGIIQARTATAQQKTPSAKDAKAKAPVAENKQGARLKLLRRANLEHFGGGLAGALQRFPAAGKAYDVTGITAKPRKGFSFWNAEGGILVVLAYDPEAGTPAPTEVILPGEEEIDPYLSVVMSLCCCAEGGCKLESKGGVIGQCTGKDCCGGSVVLVQRMGETKVLGTSCFAAPAAR